MRAARAKPLPKPVAKPKVFTGPRWIEVADRALSSGGEKTSPWSLKWDVAANCSSPVWRELVTRRPLDRTDLAQRFGNHEGVSKVATDRQSIEIDTRCRKCAGCLKARAAHWRARCAAEIAASSRTWFGTLTLRPEEHHRMKLLACHRLDRQGVTFEALSSSEQFAERHNQISKEITKWLKRVRIKCGVKLRFALVAEAHKSGLPHYHLLVHETGQPVRHALLSDSWKLGFTSFKLVNDDRAASYVCKYLSKSAIARIRASVRYGTIHNSENTSLLSIGLKDREQDPQDLTMTPNE